MASKEELPHQDRFFLQSQPRLGNQFLEDSALQALLEYMVPSDVLERTRGELEAFGDRVVTEAWDAAVDIHFHPPVLKSVNGWGLRTDDILTSKGWDTQKKISAEEGLIATAYERAHGEHSRLIQLAKLYLFNPSSGNFNCPLAMTDGATHIFEKLPPSPLRDEVFAHLTSRDPEQFWTSGQWMTERTGGSDISGTETVARLQDDGSYALTGYKYFTSATTSEMALTLARIEDSAGASTKGSKGLSLFYVQLRDNTGRLQNITVHKLKDKLGTKGVPTAELELCGTPATLLSEPGRGVSAISDMLTLTRIHNAIGAVSGMRRGLAVARDYAARRSAFGARLEHKTLHLQTLAAQEVEFRGCLALVFATGRLLGRAESGVATSHEAALLRILTPLTKLYTAKKAQVCAIECVEALGGVGYMEDSFQPAIIRDSIVLSIWEGTTNIQSLDLLRVFARSPGSFDALCGEVSALVESASTTASLAESAALVKDAIGQVREAVASGADEPAARSLAFTLSRIYISALLLDLGTRSSRSALIANRFVTAEPLVALYSGTEADRADDYEIAMDGGPAGVSNNGVDVLPDGSIRSRL